MSARIMIYSVPTLAPIREVIASANAGLVERVKEQARISFHGEMFEDDVLLQSILDRLIMSAEPITTEFGNWQHVILLLLETLEFEPLYNFPFNDSWMHYRVWEDYTLLLGSELPDESKHLLNFLREGRPIVGSTLDDTGASSYAYLDTDEIATLYDELSNLAFDDEDYLSFHYAFLESLEMIRRTGSTLFYTAG